MLWLEVKHHFRSLAPPILKKVIAYVATFPFTVSSAFEQACHIAGLLLPPVNLRQTSGVSTPPMAGYHAAV
jgi:hypothetical protein